MRVLWLCNIMLPAIAESLGREASNKEGWLTGLSEKILSRGQENQITLGVCFPVGIQEEPIRGSVRGMEYFGFREDVRCPEKYDPGLEVQFASILEEFKPDVVHLFGTEYPHALAMSRCVGEKGKILAGIQGLCFEYAKVYMADLPKHVQNRFLLRDFLRQDNIRQQQKKFEQRGRMEIETLQNIENVTGRTDWDKNSVLSVNPKLTYHFMNETLRPCFYGPEWNLSDCERYSIFVSQGNYPIKGFHYLLQALPDIVKRFPQTKVYMAGDKITSYDTLKEKLKISSYGKYCLKLMRQGGIADHIVFMGRLSANEMRDRYLKSHLFLSPSAIENSPNSVGEAMILGMPVVSSDAGGVSTMLVSEKEGLLYNCNDIPALAESVCRIFAEDELATAYGKAAREHALRTHDGDTNYRRLVEIYETLCEQKR